MLVVRAENQIVLNSQHCKLPRSRQKKILDVVDALIKA